MAPAIHTLLLPSRIIEGDRFDLAFRRRVRHECVTAVLRVRRDSMGNDPQDTVLRLRNTTVVLQSGNETKRFRVDSAVFAAIPNRGRVRLSFGGRRGSVSIETPRAVFWELSEVFYDRSAAPDHPRPKRR